MHTTIWRSSQLDPYTIYVLCVKQYRFEVWCTLQKKSTLECFAMPSQSKWWKIKIKENYSRTMTRYSREPKLLQIIRKNDCLIALLLFKCTRSLTFFHTKNSMRAYHKLLMSEILKLTELTAGRTRVLPGWHLQPFLH